MRARAQAEEKDIRLRLFKISTQDRTHANKPRNEHTNADTKAHTKAHTSTDQPTNH